MRLTLVIKSTLIFLNEIDSSYQIHLPKENVRTKKKKKKKENVRTADPDLHVGPKYAFEFATRRHCIKVKYVISFYKKMKISICVKAKPSSRKLTVVAAR